jgi:purine-nucleoside phosphorylase
MSAGEAFELFRARCAEEPPEVLVVLGSGMGPLIARIRTRGSVPFAEVPGLPSSSVRGHVGRLTLGEWATRRVLICEGRLHYYEGHSWEVVVRPIRLAAELGVREAVLTNAVGGIRDDLGPGALMPIRDQIEWNEPSPWRRARPASPYSSRMLERICRAGEACGMKLSPGVYAAVSGPNYETPAEVRALRSVGADAVGMSTSRESLAGSTAGLVCGAVSLVTNRAVGLSAEPPNHEEVLATAKATAERLGDVLEAVLRG